MSTTHTKGWWWQYYPETNYGGGPAGAAYAMTAPSGAAELTPCNHPYNEDITQPMSEFIHEALECAGQDISTKTPMTKGQEGIPGKWIQFMQNATWIDWALGIAPVEGGGGALPKTFLVHYDNGQDEFTSYGNKIDVYKLSGVVDDYLKEEIDFSPFQVKAEVVAGDADPFDLATAVANFQDIGTTTITIDGVAITDLQSFTFTVTNTYKGGGAGGTYYSKFPYLEKRDVELEMEFFTYENDHIKDLLSETADPCTIVFEPMGYANLSMTEMQVKPKSVNISTAPAKGMVTYKVTFEIGGKSVFTTPA